MWKSIGENTSQGVNSYRSYRISNNESDAQERGESLNLQIDSIENSSESLTSYTVNPTASSEDVHKSTASRLGWIAGLIVGITVLAGAGGLIAANVRRDINAGQPTDREITTKTHNFSLAENASTNYFHDQLDNTKNALKNNTSKQYDKNEPYHYYRTTHAPAQEEKHVTPNASKHYQNKGGGVNSNTAGLKISREDLDARVKNNNRDPAEGVINLKLKEFYQSEVHDILSSEVKNIDNKNNQKLFSLKYLINLLNKCKENEVNIKNSHGNKTELTIRHHQEEVLARKKIEFVIFAAEIIISNNKLLNDVYFDSIEGAFNKINTSDEALIKKEEFINYYVNSVLKLHVKND